MLKVDSNIVDVWSSRVVRSSLWVSVALYWKKTYCMLFAYVHRELGDIRAGEGIVGVRRVNARLSAAVLDVLGQSTSGGQGH